MHCDIWLPFSTSGQTMLGYLVKSEDRDPPSHVDVVTEIVPLLLNHVLMTSQMVAPGFDFMPQMEMINGGFPKEQGMDKMK